MAELVALAPVLTAVGSGVTAVGTLAGGAFKAKQLQQAAEEARASGQRSMFEKQRETGLIESKLASRAAASGAGASDPTVVALGGNIAQRGEYEALLEMYKGENRARGMEDAAKATQLESYTKAAGTLISGAGSSYAQYAKIAAKVPGSDLSYG